MLPRNSFCKKLYHAIAEAAKALIPYFEVLYVGFLKRRSDVDLFFSCVLNARIKNMLKTEGDLLIKCLWMNEQLRNEIRSENLIISNSAKIDNVWAS